MPLRVIPSAAGYVEPDAGGKLFAPAAERNAAAILALLTRVAPTSGDALEIASGTGQHVTALAAALPGLSWQPTEIDAARRASIDSHVRDSRLTNLARAIPLDATTPGWASADGGAHGGKALILLVNLLHLISVAEANLLIAEAAAALAPGGIFTAYGPFMRAGKLTSDGDRDFDATIRAQDPEAGYKDDADVIDWLQAAGLTLREAVEMPANNLALVAQRPR